MKAESKQKPVETVLGRPDLHLEVLQHGATGEKRLGDGIWLRKGNGKVYVRKRTLDPFNDGSKTEELKVGDYKPSLPWGPKYTGPIDDELMANILVYGG